MEGVGDMGALDDLTKKAQDFVEENKDTINEALNSEQAEDISDKVLDGIAEAAKKVTPDEHDAKVDDVRDKIDTSIGTEP
ncbi:antitoxin protein of toxin-antitoxin system [Agromyces ramosus]|uniref:Antitoxin protein of toxin-antitoxin system n=2 Tax=Agromyces ramosus TaxID=33879 RepID=A0A4Q7MA71_9MICO|nr:antitoxin protein of toxin-antitoxin system [Agromyces ramosus]